MLTATVTSAPRSETASVGTGTSASPSTSRFPSCSWGGNIPASAVAASRASQSGPSVTGAGAWAFRSTVIATKGMTRSAKVLSSVVSRSRRVIASSPVEPPVSESLKISSIVSALKASRIVASISLRIAAERDPRADHRADARARDVVDRVTGVLEHAQNGDVGIALRSARRRARGRASCGRDRDPARRRPAAARRARRCGRRRLRRRSVPARRGSAPSRGSPGRRPASRARPATP